MNAKMIARGKDAVNKMLVSAVLAAAVLTFAGCRSKCLPSADSDRALKVVMLGNSFGECLMHYTPEFAARSGFKLDLCTLFIGGCSFERHWQNAEKDAPGFDPYRVMWKYASLDDQTKVPFYDLLEKRGEQQMADFKRPIGYANWTEILKAEKWDVVVIHQVSEGSWRWESYQPHADRVIAKIRELAPQAEIVVQETWAYANLTERICDPKTGGKGTWGVDQEGMYEGLHACYARLAKSIGSRIIPTGTAIQTYRRALPVKDALGDDLVGNVWPDGKGGTRTDFKHLNRAGEYLQAAIWTAVLGRRDVTDVDFLPASTKLTPERAALVRKSVMSALRCYTSSKF